MLLPRIITGLILVALAIGLLFFASSAVWQIAVLSFVLVAGFEWSQFFGAKSLFHKLGYSLLAGALVFLSLFLSLDPKLLKLLLVLELAIALLAVFAYQKTAGKAEIKPQLAGIYGLVFITAFGWSMILLHELINAWLMFFSLSVVWMMDTGAYFAGRKFGKRKLANHVSPGKTWEGVIGGLLLTAIASSVVGYFYLDKLQPDLVVWVLVFSLIAGLSVFGDLFESLLKRQVGIKDSGNIFPGHGGMLDRIDSLLIATPLLWLFWSFWLA